MTYHCAVQWSMLMCCGKEARRVGRRYEPFFHTALLSFAVFKLHALNTAVHASCFHHFSPCRLRPTYAGLQGCAVVEFESAEQAAEAINTLHLSEVSEMAASGCCCRPADRASCMQLSA